jgi:hypothetical protein
VAAAELTNPGEIDVAGGNPGRDEAAAAAAPYAPLGADPMPGVRRVIFVPAAQERVREIVVQPEEVERREWGMPAWLNWGPKLSRAKAGGSYGPDVPIEPPLPGEVDRRPYRGEQPPLDDLSQEWERRQWDVWGDALGLRGYMKDRRGR